MVNPYILNESSSNMANTGVDSNMFEKQRETNTISSTGIDF